MKESSVAPDRKPERGAAVVGTAFITIFLLILVTGIIDVGRAIFTNISIQEAAQRRRSTPPSTESVTVADIAQRAVDSTSSPALNVGDVQVSCVPVPKSVKNGSGFGNRVIQPRPHHSLCRPMDWFVRSDQDGRS